MKVLRQKLPATARLRVLMGQDRFSAEYSWSDLRAQWPADLAARVELRHTPPGRLAEYLLREDLRPDVVVPFVSPLPAPALAAGGIGLVQQFGAGVDAIDIDAATRAGAWVANMPGLNARSVAEHAIALLLGLARRLPEASTGFQPGHWGEPGGRSLAGTTACIVGVGAIGSAVARRLAAFDVTLVGVRRTVRGATPPAGLPAGMRVTGVDQLPAVVSAADAVIIAASHERGRPPVVDRSVIAAMRPGTLLVNVARGRLLDEVAALEAVHAGQLGGLGVDVFTVEPYPSGGELLSHPRVIATAHTAALTGDYFRAAAERLGDALTRYLNGRPPRDLLNDPDR